MKKIEHCQVIGPRAGGGVIIYDTEDRRSDQELIHLGESKSNQIFGCWSSLSDNYWYDKKQLRACKQGYLVSDVYRKGIRSGAVPSDREHPSPITSG